MPGATAASVACCTLARPRKAFMIPQTVPNRPMYGLTDPADARNASDDSSASISRWNDARIARPDGFEHRGCRRPAIAGLLSRPAKLLHPGLEDPRERPRIALGLGDGLVKAVQFGAPPELALEGIGRRLGRSGSQTTCER